MTMALSHFSPVTFEPLTFTPPTNLSLTALFQTAGEARLLSFLTFVTFKQPFPPRPFACHAVLTSTDRVR